MTLDGRVLKASGINRLPCAVVTEMFGQQIHIKCIP